MLSFSSYLFTRTNHGLLGSLPRIGTVSLLALLALIIIPACDKTAPATDNTPKVEILNDKVVVDSALIITSSPERYQPSYNLTGALIAIEQKSISSPYNADNPQPLVKVGDWVTKNQPLLRLQSTIDSSEIHTAHYEFVDIQLDASNTAGVKDLEDRAQESPLTGNLSNKTSITSPIATSNQESNQTSSQTISKATDKTPVSSHSAAENHGATKSSSVLTESVAGKSVKADDDLTISKNTKLNELNKADQHEIVGSIHAGQDSESGIVPTITMPIKTQVTLILTSPIDGEVTTLADFSKPSYTATTAATPLQQGVKRITAYTPLITVADTRSLQLVGKLPLEAESQLSVGQAVKFTIYDAAAEFTGQISHVLPQPEKGYLTVRAPVVPSQENKALLEPGMQALMTIEYGQIELGVRVPRQAIHEANLSALGENYTRPVSPIHGFIWIISQDKRLAYTPIEIVEYFADSDQFLVHGINNDSLICLADLPKNVDGFKISVN